MLFGSVYQALDPSRDRAKDFLAREGMRPQIFSRQSLGTFFAGIPEVARLIAREPEILFFAVLQWLVIWLAYLAWTQMLQWIPNEVWNAVRDASESERKNDFTLINLVLLGWSFLVVCVASYPIGIRNAAMVAVHDLRTSGEKVTIANCLAVAVRHLYRIWMFTVVDSWITVQAILDRLPKKQGHRTAHDELLYYAWKVSTMAVVPALVNGRGFFQAGRDSLLLLTSQPWRALGLRLGYSAVCWIIGVLSYLGSIVVIAKFGAGTQGPHWLYDAYFLMAVPLFFAIGVISVLVRPFFLLSVAKFYTDLVDVKAEIEADIAAAPAWERSVLSWHSAVFLVLLAMVVADMFFADQLGLTAWIKELADKDLLGFHQTR